MPSRQPACFPNATRPRTPARQAVRQVRLIGAGPVGYQLARLLVASGLGALYVYDDEPTDLALYPAAGVLSSRSEALRSALAEAETTVSTAEPLVQARRAPGGSHHRGLRSTRA